MTSRDLLHETGGVAHVWWRFRPIPTLPCPYTSYDIVLIFNFPVTKHVQQHPYCSLQHVVVCTESATIDCLVQRVSVSRTPASQATLASDVTFAYSAAADVDDFDATPSPTASDKAAEIKLAIS